MLRLRDIAAFLEEMAPPSLQESYDNTGWITGFPDAEAKGAIVCLDSTEAVIDEAIAQGCNLVIAHHPIVFSGLKKLTGRNYVERAVMKAIKHDIAIYAIHTNLDNVRHGVNKRMADRLGLVDTRILAPKADLLQKLVVFVPAKEAEVVAEAMWAAGAGSIGKYDECSFQSAGQGTFRPLEGAQPASGSVGHRSAEEEIRLEVLLPSYSASSVVRAMQRAHPYEEVAFDLVPLRNSWQDVGSGLIGRLPEPMAVNEFLHHVKSVFKAGVVRHTKSLHNHIETVALCGGSGSFLTRTAMSQSAHAYITADVKYHEFFDAEDQVLLADIGHYESEQYTIDLLSDWLAEKFPTFATRKTRVVTNPLNYL